MVEIPTVVLLCLFQGLVAGLLRPRPSLKQIELKVTESSVSKTVPLLVSLSPISRSAGKPTSIQKGSVWSKHSLNRPARYASRLGNLPKLSETSYELSADGCWKGEGSLLGATVNLLISDQGWNFRTIYGDYLEPSRNRVVVPAREATCHLSILTHRRVIDALSGICWISLSTALWFSLHYFILLFTPCSCFKMLLVLGKPSNK